MTTDETAAEPQEEEAQDVPFEAAGHWPVRLLDGRSLYLLPWTGVTLADTGNTFSAREWARRKLAKKVEKRSRRRNRR